MSDLSWMLRPQAIRVAKQCIRIIEQENGVKLKLSQPDFLEEIHRFVDLDGSAQLTDAYTKLLAMGSMEGDFQNLTANIPNNYSRLTF